MKTYKLTSIILAATLALTGCGDKDKKEEAKVGSPEAEICSFDDFQYLMYTEGNKSVLKDEEGNEFTLNTDGYYYDTDGKKIITYGVGDVATYNLGGSSGAIPRSNLGGIGNSKNVLNGTTNNSGKEESNESTLEGEEVNDNHGESTESTESDDSDEGEYIEDWQSVKVDLMEAEGVVPTTEAPWHGQSDDLQSFEAGSGDNKLSSSQSYNTVIDLGVDIPGVLNLSEVTTGSVCSVSGYLTLDGASFNEHMASIYGETIIDPEGNEIPIDYTTYITQQYVTVCIKATDGYGYVFSDLQTLYFDENYTVNFDVSLEIPEGYTTQVLSIQDVHYNL